MTKRARQTKPRWEKRERKFLLMRERPNNAVLCMSRVVCGEVFQSADGVWQWSFAPNVRDVPLSRPAVTAVFGTAPTKKRAQQLIEQGLELFHG